MSDLNIETLLLGKLKDSVESMKEGQATILKGVTLTDLENHVSADIEMEYEDTREHDDNNDKITSRDGFERFVDPIQTINSYAVRARYMIQRVRN